MWLNVFYRSDVIRVGNRTELIRMCFCAMSTSVTDPPVSTVGGALMVFTALLGYSGILLNNRSFLAVYVVLLWCCLAFIVAPGYIAYKKKTFNLEGKINLQWSRHLGTIGRLRIQDALKCCGYFSPANEYTISPLCYPRSNEDGCKNRYIKLERIVLRTWYTVSFSLVPAHMLIILCGLLCANHVTYRFGKGLTPERYRLDLDSMAIIMNDYATQIAAQYGPDVAQEAVTRSSLHLNDSSRPGSRAGSLAGSRRGSVSTQLGAGRPSSRLAQTTGPYDNNNNYDSPFADDNSESQHNHGNYYGGSQNNHGGSQNNHSTSPTYGGWRQ